MQIFDESLYTIVCQMLASTETNTISKIEPIFGGGNNRAYIVCNDTNKYFLKHYYDDSCGTRNRLRTDFGFSEFAWKYGISYVAEPIASDEMHSLGLYEFIHGKLLSADEIKQQELQQALTFIEQLNLQRKSADARALPVASEACFSIIEHIRCVDLRVKKLHAIVVDDEISLCASQFVFKELIPIWEQVKKNIIRETKEFLESQLDIEDRVLSPSDFGYHNAKLCFDNQIKFFDFEYAGWDDPAKLIVDFFLQPKVPVPMQYFQYFADGIVRLTKNVDFTYERIKVLFPLFILKWSCIVLNCFLPSFKERKEFVGDITEEFRSQQICKSKKLLNQII